MLKDLRFFARSNWLPKLLLISLVTLVGAAFILLAQKTPGTADTLGYQYAGVRLAAGEGLTFADENNALAGQFFSPYAFQIKQPNDFRMYLGFPPGLPILLALPVALTGNAGAAYFVVPVIAVFGLILTFLMGKWITNNQWSALLATILVAATPIYWQFSTDFWSEVPSLVFILGGSLLYFKSRKDDVFHKNAAILSILAGTLLIFALFIRYANITFLLSISLAEFLARPTKLIRPSKRWVFYIVLGIGICLLLIFNYFYYGGLSLTSYSPENGWYAFPPFSWQYAFGPSPVDGYSLVSAIKTLWANSPLLLLLAPVGLFLVPKSYRLLLALTVLSSVFLYGIYAFAPTDINSRFLIPILPFLAIACAEAVLFLLKKIQYQGIQLATLFILLLFLSWNIPGQISKIRSRNVNSGKMVSNVQEWVAATHAEAVFLSYKFNDQIAYYGDRSVLNYRRIPQYDPVEEKYRHDIFEPCLIFAIDTLLLNKKPVYYIEDGSPSLYDSKVVLQQYYNLTPYRESPKVFMVQADNISSPRGMYKACSP